MENVNLKNLRIRLAPSPTGYVHIGSLRTALFNYLLAKHYDGTYILRIEDTDQTRLVPDAVDNLLKSMKWAGLEAEEGPYLTTDNKIKERGDFGPYTQSKRLDLYHTHIKTLLDKGKAYPCFCTKTRLDEIRTEQQKNKQAPKYDNHCRNMSKEEAKKLIDAGTPHVIRFKMPENKKVVVKDLIRGEIIVNSNSMDDFVLIKSDGFPTYHFAVVVDDHLMKISLVTRGEEWVASAPKHFLLYDALSWPAPHFAHLPQILNKNKKKMSKRDGDTSVQDFIDKGYLKDALINFIALLGWNSGTEQEVYTIPELIRQFSLEKIHKASAIFDVEKLDWLNGVYIRKLSIDEFYEMSIPYLEKAGLIKADENVITISETGEQVKPTYVKNILALEQSRIKKLTEISEAVEYFFKKDLEYDTDKIIWKKSDKEKTIENLKILEKLFKKIKIDDFTLENLEIEIKKEIENNGLDNGSILWPMRYALSGRDRSPGPFELAATLGKKKTLERLNIAVMKLLG